MQAEILRSLREKYGEGFYLLNSKQFRNNFIELKQAFSKIYPHFNIAYSYKTNYIPKFCKIINELGGYAEVVSEMELKLARTIGVEPKNIIWNGPIKSEAGMEEFLLDGGVINVDSTGEFEVIKKIIERNNDKHIRIGVRVNFDIGDGVVSRFGVDALSSEFDEIISYIKNANNVELVNFQCHYAKRQIDYWPNRATEMIKLLKRIGITPGRIDLGGGLFGKMEESLRQQFSYIPNYEEYANAVATVFQKEYGDNGPELIIEPGSALVGDCMQFAGTIKTIKKVRYKWFASVMGSQKNISMTSVNPPIEVFHMGGKTQMYKSIDFVGYTCIEGDVIYKNYEGELACGDMILISNCGSYSVVMKPPFILPNFAIVDISEGKEELIKRAETFEDLFNTYKI